MPAEKPEAAGEESFQPKHARALPLRSGPVGRKRKTRDRSRGAQTRRIFQGFTEVDVHSHEAKFILRDWVLRWFARTQGGSQESPA